MRAAERKWGRFRAFRGAVTTEGRAAREVRREVEAHRAAVRAFGDKVAQALQETYAEVEPAGGEQRECLCPAKAAKFSFHRTG